MSIIMNKTRLRRGLAGEDPGRASALPLEEHHPGRNAPEETAMRAKNPTNVACIPLVFAALAAGCATPRSNSAAYEQALSQWQGGPAGQPRAPRGAPGGRGGTGA